MAEMKGKIIAVTPDKAAPDFGFKHGRNVLLLADRQKKLHTVSVTIEGRSRRYVLQDDLYYRTSRERKGAKPVIKEESAKILRQDLIKAAKALEVPSHRQLVPTNLIFKPGTRAGKELVGRTRLVTLDSLETFLRTDASVVLNKLRQHPSVEGHMLHYAESVEEYASQRDGKK
jgi:hypothetical protein